MGLLVSALEFRQSPENPRTPLSAPAAWLYEALGAASTDAGIAVSTTSAMRYTAVYSCINILAQGIAQVPWDVMRKNGRIREVADSRYEHYLLHNQPNGKMSSYVFRTTLMTQALSTGNFYAQIIRDGASKVRAIRPICDELVSVAEHPTLDMLVYEVTRKNGLRERLDGIDVIHVPCISLNGYLGLSPIAQARQAIALGLAAEKMGAALFGRGSRPSGVLTYEGAKLRPEQIQQILEAWNAANAGTSNAGGTALLHGGLKWQSTAINPDDAQFLETRAFQVADIARIYRVPPQLLGLKDANPTYASVEQFFKSFVNLSLAPWVTAIEQEFNRKLFPDQSDIYCKLDMRGLMRGDAAARAQFYNTLVNVGALSPNDIRELEDMNPVPGGDQYLVQGALTPLDTIGDQAAADQQPAQQPARNLLPIMRDLVGRIVNREVWARDKYAAKGLLPLIEVIDGGKAEAGDVRAYVSSFSARSRNWSVEQAEAVAKDELDALLATFGGKQ